MASYSFTWTAPDGATHDVTPDWDVDQWTGREVRELERVQGGILGGGRYATTLAVFAVAIARQVPGYTITSADAELTLGKVEAALAEMRLKERADRKAQPEPEPAPEPTGRVVDFTGDVVLAPVVVEDVEGAEVLSPTSDASEDGSALA